MLHAGWASEEVALERPVPLAGQFFARVSTHVNDPITVTALALEADGGHGQNEQAILLSCDLASVPAEVLEQVRRAIAPRLPGFDTNKLVMNATHTHTGPVLREGRYPPQGADVMTPTECTRAVVAAAAGAAVRAWDSRGPAGFSRAFGHAVVGHNRRAVFLDGAAKMYANTDDENFDCIEGYEDHGVDLLFVWDEHNALAGLIVNLACPSQVTEGARYLSADFWHETREEIRRRHGANLFVLPQCAAAGDQSPHFLLYKREEEYMRERKGVSEREEIARRIAHAVDDVLEAARGDIRTDLPFAHVTETLELPARIITREELQEAENACKQWQALRPASESEASRAFSMLNRNQAVIERYEARKTNPFYAMELHVLRLGDIVMAANPFELFLDFGLRIKARSKAPQTFVVQLACGRGIYLPTQKAVRGSHYGAGASDNLVGPEGGQVLVNRTVELIDALWAVAAPAAGSVEL